jgi:hypothetical protein
MEVLLGIGVLLIILFFSKVVSFNKKMMDIEIEGYKIYSEEDLLNGYIQAKKSHCGLHHNGAVGSPYAGGQHSCYR